MRSALRILFPFLKREKEMVGYRMGGQAPKSTHWFSRWAPQRSWGTLQGLPTYTDMLSFHRQQGFLLWATLPGSVSCRTSVVSPCCLPGMASGLGPSSVRLFPRRGAEERPESTIWTHAGSWRSHLGIQASPPGWRKRLKSTAGRCGRMRLKHQREPQHEG